MPGTSSAQLRQLLRMSGWFFATIVVIEIAIHLTVAPPDPLKEPTGASVGGYLEYGRSVEGKLRRMVGPTEAETHPVVPAGWIPDEVAEATELKAEPTKTAVAVYGMSFAGHIAHSMLELDPDLRLRFIGGPGAPPNHTFAVFMADDAREAADVVVWAVLASSVRGMYSMSGQTIGFEQPAPFTYPRYDEIDDELVAEEPRIQTLAEFRHALKTRERWEAWVDQLRQHDELYSPFLFREGWLDQSAVVRLVRRAWARHVLSRVTAKFMNEDGIVQSSLPGRVLPVLAREFARTARSEGRLPVVLLIQDAGQGDATFRLLEPTLQAHDIPCLSTHEDVPPDDPSQFLPDAHFRPEGNLRAAKSLHRLIRLRLAHEDDARGTSAKGVD